MNFLADQNLTKISAIFTGSALLTLVLFYLMQALIAVDDVEKSTKTYQEAFDVKDVEYETVESEGVKIAILHLENANIELMEPTNDSSPIKKFLEKRGSGLHHIALETKNIEGDVTRMEGCGIQFLGKIKPGSAGTRVTFIHPKSLSGVLGELCSKS